MKFKPIEGFPGYSISRFGVVMGPTKVLKPILCDGYFRVFLYNNHVKHSKFIHRLVAKAWVENPNKFNTVNHKDAIKTNNSYRNLEWCTQSQNMKHAWSLGLPKSSYGESNGMSRLTKDDVISIRNDHKSGMSYRKIIEKHGIIASHFYKIKNNKIWTHI